MLTAVSAAIAVLASMGFLSGCADPEEEPAPPPVPPEPSPSQEKPTASSLEQIIKDEVLSEKKDPKEKRLKIDPESKAVQKFFDQLGIPFERLKSGKADFKDIDPAFFEMVGSLEKGQRDGEISPFEAFISYDLIKDRHRRIQALYRPGDCVDGEIAGAIFRNMLHIKHGLGLKLFKIHDVKECDYQYLINRYEPKELAGLFFDPQRMPPFWRDVGLSVLHLRRDGHPAGSAVVVSPKGHILTAAHCLADKQGKLYKSFQVEYIGTRYDVERDSIVLDSKGDLALAQVKGLEDLPSLKYATLAEKSPNREDHVVSIGYPQGYDQRFAVGSYVSWTYTRGNPKLWATNRIFYGFSGGGFFNSQGELLGINTNLVSDSREMAAAGLKSYFIESPKLEKAIEEIVVMQRQIREGAEVGEEEEGEPPSPAFPSTIR